MKMKSKIKGGWHESFELAYFIPSVYIGYISQREVFSPSCLPAVGRKG
jgi:hypothetical protein